MSDKAMLAPEFAAMRAMLPALDSESLTVADMRAGWSAGSQGVPETLYAIRDLHIPLASHSLAARLYQPGADAAGIVLFMHGGGWVSGGLDTHDIAVRGLARRSGCAILAIDYRLAPEAPFPHGLDDCFGALEWLVAHRDALGVGGKPVLVAGDSAGGNLAGALAIRSRDGGGPAIDGQVLIYPVTDGSGSTPSYRDRATDGLLTADRMKLFWNHYAPGARGRDPLASICRQPTLAGLPPAVVAIAEFDPLRDEGLHYAARLAAEGVECTTLVFDDLPHGFITFYRLSDAADRALSAIALALNALAITSPVARPAQKRESR